MFKDVHEYLSRLKRELKGSDPALTQDALADAEEHLRTALDNAKKEAPNISEAEALSAILDKYGEPNEVASAYKEIEHQISSFLLSRQKRDLAWLNSLVFMEIPKPGLQSCICYFLLLQASFSVYGPYLECLCL